MLQLFSIYDPHLRHYDTWITLSSARFMPVSSVPPCLGSTSMFPWCTLKASWCHHCGRRLLLPPCDPTWIHDYMEIRHSQWRRDHVLPKDFRRALIGELSQLASSAQIHCLQSIHMLSLQYASISSRLKEYWELLYFRQYQFSSNCEKRRFRQYVNSSFHDNTQSFQYTILRADVYYTFQSNWFCVHIIVQGVRGFVKIKSMNLTNIQMEVTFAPHIWP